MSLEYVQLSILSLSPSISFDRLKGLVLLLDDDEKKRLSAMGDEGRKVEYVASHALARIKIAEVLGVQPKEVPLVFKPGKKPRFDSAVGVRFIAPGLDKSSPYETGIPHLSLSHDSSLVACACAPVPVGIDLVKRGRIQNPEDLAGRILSKKEWTDWKKLGEKDRKKRFDELWGLKEAFYKAADWPLKDVIEKTHFIFLNDRPEPWREWQFDLFEPALGFVGAVAYGSQNKLSLQSKTVSLGVFLQSLFGR